MSWYAPGNHPINSTAGITAAPSTASLIAELDSTQLRTKDFGATYELNFNVKAILGASTTAIWQVEHAISTGLGSTAIIDTVFIQTPTGQSGEYTFDFRLQKDSRIRARLNSTAANAMAFLQAQALV